MMFYAELIDELAEKIYKISIKPTLESYDLGQLNAYKDLRREIMDKMDKELDNLSIDTRH